MLRIAPLNHFYLTKTSVSVWMCWSDDRRRRCVMSACTQEMLWCHKNRAGLRWGSFFFKTRFCIILVKCWMIYINMFHLKKRRLWFKRSDWWMWEKQTNHWTKLKMKVFCVCFYHFYANKSSTKAFILPVRWRFLLMQINVDLSSCCCLFICWFECFFPSELLRKVVWFSADEVHVIKKLQNTFGLYGTDEFLWCCSAGRSWT